MNLKVEQEFQEKIPPLTDAEFEQLKENILTDGEVYEPISVWNGVIVDGHNRWKIVQEHPEIPYRVKEMEFADKWAAFDWMYKKQLGRRNLTDEQKTYLIGKMYEARKKSHGASDGFRGNQSVSIQNGNLPKPQGRIGEQIASELGIGNGTVLRANQFRQGVDALKAVSPEAAEKVMQGKANVTKAMIRDLPNRGEKEIKAVAKAIESGANLKAAHFPSSKKHEKIDAPAPTISEDKDAVVEFCIDDLVEELTALGNDFLRKWNRALQIHAQLVSENAAEVSTVMNNIVKEFEKMEAF